VCCHIVATLCFFARSRFRIPLEPFFLFWIVWGVVHGGLLFFNKLKNRQCANKNGYNTGGGY